MVGWAGGKIVALHRGDGNDNEGQQPGNGRIFGFHRENQRAAHIGSPTALRAALTFSRHLPWVILGVQIKARWQRCRG